MTVPLDVGVVIAAAGSGARAGGGVPKQFRDVAGVPLLLRAVRPFLSHPEVALVVAVLPASQIHDPPQWLASLVGERLQLVIGGDTRTASVTAGIAALSSRCRIVLVHDAARPFPDRDVIDAVIREARGGHGAIAALRVTDTLKEEADLGSDPASGLRSIARTVPRDHLWRAQTPQGFPRDLLEDAHARAAADAFDGTDDAALAERIGARIVLIPDSPRNLKVTTAEDFLVAEALALGKTP